MPNPIGNLSWIQICFKQIKPHADLLFHRKYRQGVCIATKNHHLQYQRIFACFQIKSRPQQLLITRKNKKKTTIIWKQHHSKGTKSKIKSDSLFFFLFLSLHALIVDVCKTKILSLSIICGINKRYLPNTFRTQQ